MFKPRTCPPAPSPDTPPEVQGEGGARSPPDAVAGEPGTERDQTEQLGEVDQQQREGMGEVLHLVEGPGEDVVQPLPEVSSRRSLTNIGGQSSG